MEVVEGCTQALLQPPQLAASVLVFTHVPEQLVWPAGQQMPLEQLPLAHAELALQGWPLGRVGWLMAPLVQTPPRHCWVEGQALPHAPQFLASVWVSVQAPLQQVGVAAGQHAWPQRSGCWAGAAGPHAKQGPWPLAARLPQSGVAVRNMGGKFCWHQLMHACAPWVCAAAHRGCATVPAARPSKPPARALRKPRRPRAAARALLISSSRLPSTASAPFAGRHACRSWCTRTVGSCPCQVIPQDRATLTRLIRLVVRSTGR